MPATALDTNQDPAASAAAAGLCYVSDTRPGITRKRAGRGFTYTTPDGKPLRDARTLARIRSLAIPPAWENVWISPNPQGHIQATGTDARKRKQYRYHPRWTQVRDENKYARMVAFGKKLPTIRNRVGRDLARHGLPREKVLAAVVKLLETTLIRVGNDSYAKDNDSFGLTTLRDDHVAVNGSRIRFEFTGKSGIDHEINLADARLARIVTQCQDLPGQELFQYVDDGGSVRDVGSDDVNAYIRQIAGEDFTAKDFRTWAGTVLAAMALQEFESFDSEAQAKRNLLRAIEAVAERLGNTRAVCRKCYIHPAVLDSYMDGSLVEELKRRAEAGLKGSLKALPPEEASVLTLLQQRLAREATEPRVGGRVRLRGKAKPRRKAPSRAHGRS